MGDDNGCYDVVPLNTLKLFLSGLFGMKTRKRWIGFLVICALSSLVIFFNLGAHSLHNSDEATHSIIANSILTHGSWLSLSFEGVPYFKKPPLKYWLSALTFKWFGMNEFTARLWSALFAFGTALSLYFLGGRLFGFRTGLASALILLTSHQFIYNHCARTGELDSALLFFWTMALLLFVLGLEQRSRTHFLLAFACVGACGMVKHIGFLPEILLIMGLYALISGTWRHFSIKQWVLALGVTAVVVLPWHLTQLWIHGDVFVDTYLLDQVVDRAKGLSHSRTRTNLGRMFYLVVFKNGAFPWLLLLPFSLIEILGRETAKIKRRALLLVVWFCVAFAVVTLSKTKHSWYALPLYPPMAILVGHFMTKMLRERRDKFVSVGLAVGAIIAFASTTTATTHNPFAVRARLEMIEVNLVGRLQHLGPAAWFGIAALSFLVAAFLGWSRSDNWRFRLSCGLALALFGLASFQVIAPLRYSEFQRPLHQIVDAANEEAGDGVKVFIVFPNNLIVPNRYGYYIRQIDPPGILVRPNVNGLRKRIRQAGKRSLILTTREFSEALASSLGPKQELLMLAESRQFVLTRIARRRHQRRSRALVRRDLGSAQAQSL